jgi:hypothetical protein
MKAKKMIYPEGFCVEIRLNALRTYNSMSEEILLSAPCFSYMSLKPRLAVWKSYSQHLRRLGVAESRLRRFFNELRIDRDRYSRQCNRDNTRDQQGLMARIRGMALTPQSFKYDRAVGVEIECYGPQLEDKLPMWAREKGDGSLGSRSDGVEFNLLLKREFLEPRLFNFCKLMATYGHKVDKTCGLHVHLDMRGRSFEDVQKLAKKVDKWLYALRELVPQSRRENSYCQFGTSRTDRYKAVNLCAFEKFKTLEIRLHSGTTDYTKIISWLRLVEFVAAMPKAPKAASCIATLESLPLPAHEMAYWLARHKELNPRIYNTVATQSECEESALPRR